MEILDAAGLLRRCGDAPTEDSRHHRDWEHLMHRFGARLEAGARRALRRAGIRERPELVEDLVQEISRRLWERRSASLGRFRGSTEAQAACYLLRLAENAATDSLRAEAAQKRSNGGRMASLDSLREIADERAPDPLRRTLGRERLRWLVAQVRDLCRGGNARRNAWILRRALVDGWTSREIAGALGSRAALGAVQAMVCRARRRLERCAEGERL